MACITTTAPTQLFPAVKAVAKTSIERIDLQHSDCSTSNYSGGHVGPDPTGRGRLQQSRYAPYSIPALHRSGTQRTEQTVVQLQACRDAQQRHTQMLQLSISLANSSLEATLTAFQLACVAPPRSPEALQALDAAEASLTQTTRLTSIASVLAKRCAQAGAAVGPCDALPQGSHQLREHLTVQLTQQLQQQAALLAAVGVPAAVPVVQSPAVIDDVEDGEEVTSSATFPQCSCSQCTTAQ